MQCGMSRFRADAAGWVGRIFRERGVSDKFEGAQEEEAGFARIGVDIRLVHSSLETFSQREAGSVGSWRKSGVGIGGFLNGSAGGCDLF